MVYCPTILTNEAKNHYNVFIALSDATIYVFDWHLGQFSPVVIQYFMLFTNPKGDTVTAMKCHPLKMHRLLIAFEETAVIMYSLNKDREIQKIEFSTFDQDKGRALGVEWMPGDSFMIAFSTGLLCLYRAEDKS
jgi:hypothetical protein